MIWNIIILLFQSVKGPANLSEIANVCYKGLDLEQCSIFRIRFQIADVYCTKCEMV